MAEAENDQNWKLNKIWVKYARHCIFFKTLTLFWHSLLIALTLLRDQNLKSISVCQGLDNSQGPFWVLIPDKLSWVYKLISVLAH